MFLITCADCVVPDMLVHPLFCKKGLNDVSHESETFRLNCPDANNKIQLTPSSATAGKRTPAI